MINLTTISRLLNDFRSFLNNRELISLVAFEEVFPKILQWHFEAWQKEEIYSEKKEKIELFGNYSDIRWTLDSIIQEVEERTLK